MQATFWVAKPDLANGWDPKAFYPANGFSEEGLQQAPAVGCCIVELMLGLSIFDPGRVLEKGSLNQSERVQVQSLSQRNPKKEVVLCYRKLVLEDQFIYQKQNFKQGGRNEKRIVVDSGYGGVTDNRGGGSWFYPARTM